MDNLTKKGKYKLSSKDKVYFPKETRINKDKSIKHSSKNNKKAILLSSILIPVVAVGAYFLLNRNLSAKDNYVVQNQKPSYEETYNTATSTHSLEEKLLFNETDLTETSVNSLEDTIPSSHTSESTINLNELSFIEKAIYNRLSNDDLYNTFKTEYQNIENKLDNDLPFKLEDVLSLAYCESSLKYVISDTNDFGIMQVNSKAHNDLILKHKAKQDKAYQKLFENTLPLLDNTFNYDFETYKTEENNSKNIHLSMILLTQIDDIFSNSYKLNSKDDKLSKFYNDLTDDEKFKVLSFAYNVGIPTAKKHLSSEISKDSFNLDDTLKNYSGDLSTRMNKIQEFRDNFETIKDYF